MVHTMFRHLLLAATFLAALVVTGRSVAAPEPAPRPTPFPASVTWYNVAQPLTWQDLQGRVVLLDFFTPGCINCVHMLPVEERLAQRFGKQLVIIGINSPKFSNSKTAAGLQTFMAVHDIRHPVVLDADYRIWNAWHVFAWPTFFLIGSNGNVLQRMIGERTFEQLAEPIAQALSRAPAPESLPPLPMQSPPAAASALEAPGGVAVSGKWVAISDTGHDRVILATKSGQLRAVFGAACADGDNDGDDDGDTAAVGFSRPHGLTFHAGRLFVADTEGQRVRVIDWQAGTVTTLAGSGQRAYVAAGTFAAAEAQLNSPWDVAWAGGKLYVSMAGNHAIWRYDPATQTIGPWAGSGREGLRNGNRQRAEFAQPSGLDAHAGTLYVAGPESSSIRAIDLTKGSVDTLIGQGLFKFGLRDGKAAQALLQHAEDVIWHDGALYIADTFNNALRRLDLDTMRVATVTTALDHPQALAVLAPNKLLVAESGGDRIDAVNLDTGAVTRWRVDGLQPPATVCGDEG